jgi:hypothetical protein
VLNPAGRPGPGANSLKSVAKRGMLPHAPNSGITSYALSTARIIREFDRAHRDGTRT